MGHDTKKIVFNAKKKASFSSNKNKSKCFQRMFLPPYELSTQAGCWVLLQVEGKKYVCVAEYYVFLEHSTTSITTTH